MSLSERKQPLKLADSFFIWRSPRYGGEHGSKGEGEGKRLVVMVVVAAAAWEGGRGRRGGQGEG